MKVIKRDDRMVDYNQNKIIAAINSANKNKDVPENKRMTEDDIAKVLSLVEKQLKGKESIEVDEIQNLVEDALMNKNFYAVARAYIKYREERTRLRNKKSDIIKSINEKLSASNVQNQNANVDEHSFGGRRGEAESELARQMALDYYMCPKSANNHKKNRHYIHDLDAFVVGMHNCAGRETKFITDKGVFSFEDFNDGDIVNVLTHTGNYKKAVVHSYGKQKLNKITLYRNQLECTVRFTPNHRWLLSDGSITESLKVGDTILKAPNIRNFDFDSASDLEKYYWCLGFVLGDGTEATRWSHGKKIDDIKFVRLRLCGDKVIYEKRFANLKHSTKELENGDLYLTFSQVINFRKEFPDLDKMNISEIRALFDGLYCADGQKAGNRKIIMTTNEQIASFIEDYAPSIGYYITKEVDKTGQKTNFGVRGFTKEFTFISDKNSYNWKVINIEEDKEETVWCLDVEDDHSFVLPNSVVTGNCLSCPMDELLANGFTTRQVFIRPANSLNTAMQLIAVIFQIQSLQQFGGVSATHLDWTMIPYVRKSFFKHYIASYLKRTEDFEKMNLMDIMFQDYEQTVMHPKLGKITIKRNKFEDWVEENQDKCLKELNLKKEDFTFDNKDMLDKSLYQCALYDTIAEVKQAVEGLFHNLNSLQSRSGSQLPFSSINYGTCTLEEGRLVTKAILETSIKGVGNGRTSIFPCQIFHYSKKINGVKGTPNYDLYKLALKSTSRRLYPNYANIDWSNQKSWIKEDREMKTIALSKVSKEDKIKLVSLIKENPKIGEMLSLEVIDENPVVTYKEAPTEIFSTMGCRTINGSDVNFREEDYLSNIKYVIENGKLPKGRVFSKAQKDGRGNIIPTTIILPTLAMEAKKKSDKRCTPIIDEFMSILEKSIDDTKDELLERYKWICAQNPASATFMYENKTMSGYVPEEGIESALKHGTLVIGQLGMAETLQILVGCNQLKKKGMDLAKRIETMFKEKTAEFKKQYSLNFGVYYTPAENLCYTAMTKFKKKYGVIPNVSDHEYFTNSIHVPVWEKVSPFEKIDTESQLTGFSNAGCITYVELEDSAKDNIGALEQIVNYAMEKDIPYFALNLRLSHCCVCGYDGYIEDECPICHAKDLKEDGTPTGDIEQLARVTGYLSSDYRQFNKGKQAEVRDRYKHTKELTDWKR